MYTTPKPGLADLCSNGAHTDMDVSVFEKSIDALFSLVCQNGRTGIYMELFYRRTVSGYTKDRYSGRKKMYQITGGINTHKGLIFRLGIFVQQQDGAPGRGCAHAGTLNKNRTTDDI